jgi:hypothetical protein
MGNAYDDSLIKVILAGKVTQVFHKPWKYNFILADIYTKMNLYEAIV